MLGYIVVDLSGNMTILQDLKMENPYYYRCPNYVQLYYRNNMLYPVALPFLLIAFELMEDHEYVLCSSQAAPAKLFSHR